MYCKCGYGGPGSSWNCSNVDVDVDELDLRCPKCDEQSPYTEYNLQDAFCDFKKEVSRRQSYDLRDWFAGMAMQGDISASGDMVLDVEALVGWSYEVANAMMEARDG